MSGSPCIHDFTTLAQTSLWTPGDVVDTEEMVAEIVAGVLPFSRSVPTALHLGVPSPSHCCSGLHRSLLEVGQMLRFKEGLVGHGSDFDAACDGVWALARRD